jgi:hypothetical protein
VLVFNGEISSDDAQRDSAVAAGSEVARTLQHGTHTGKLRPLGERVHAHKNIRLVEFVEQSSDVLACVTRAVLIVQPSKFEGVSDVLLKGIDLGAAVISGDSRSGPSGHD